MFEAPSVALDSQAAGSHKVGRDLRGSGLVIEAALEASMSVGGAQYRHLAVQASVQASVQAASAETDDRHWQI